MQFTRLRLNGFKSFVDPTDLVIAQGLTGVVGPNGCGKSNLLEALRWVMGETRPSAMRGDGMEDVIFAGASTRPARNFAEVSLTIDNAARRAPAAFNASAMIDITRRITRDAGSAYLANGREMRARDVQMLFADASTGAHSPALVRQGQISELINARPKARRRILEEAAGISGLYQRRHEAELKLRATEANLERVDDVIEQLAAQLAQLARQARQAARYREIGAELRRAEGLLLYRRWREADAALAEAAAALATANRSASQAEARIRQAEDAREAADAALPPLREDLVTAAAILQRAEVERAALDRDRAQAEETVRTLEARRIQITTDRDRETDLIGDAEATLERLAEEEAALIEAGEGHDARLQACVTAADAASSTLQASEATLSDLTEDAARLAARHQSAARLVADSQAALARYQSHAETARAERGSAAATQSQAEAQLDAASGRLRDAAQALETATATLAQAETANLQARAAETEARARAGEADGEARALTAEASAIERLLSRDAPGGDPVLDAVKAEPGAERGLGAALGDDLNACAIGEADGFGWTALGPLDGSAALPAGAEPLTDRVSGPPELSRRLSQTGLVPAGQGRALQRQLRPGQRLVSVEGDLWRWDGFSLAADEAPSTAALRLEQRNKLAVLRKAAAAAAERAAATEAEHEDAARRLADLSSEEKAARHGLRDAERALSEAQRAVGQAEAARDRAAARADSLDAAVARHAHEADAAATHLAEAEARAADLGDLDGARLRVAEQRARVEADRIAMLSAKARLEELRRDGTDRASRLERLASDRATWTHRRDTADARIADFAERLQTLASELATASAAPAEFEARRNAMAATLSAAGARHAAAQDAVSTAEGAQRKAALQEREASQAAAEAREARARTETRRDAAAERLAEAAHAITEETGADAGTLLERLDADPSEIPDVAALEAAIARLRRQRDALGAVNLRAEEDASALRVEHETLVGERGDLQEAVGKLRAGIAGLNREGRERLLTAFEQVNANFATLFTHLFAGGEANLVLVESDDPLEAGLEIMCQPPGKKLATLSLLSGGEQTLTALALIFAVFLANPAPICVLDEVDAPLDDANVTRFCDLLDEMTRRTDTRFLIITHHAVTMARMDRLFGVTMGEQGVSQLVSVDLQKAETLVA